MNRILLIFCFLLARNVYAQEDLLDSIETTLVPKLKTENVRGTFKGTRLINLHTVETLGKGSLDFRISHRFGDFSSGSYNLWGLDGPAVIKFGFDYSVTNRLVVGVGRSSYHKLFDGYIKLRILEQSIEKVPVSIVGIASANLTTEKNTADRYSKFVHRLSYFYQLLIARKFNSRLSLQISPIMIHYNLVENQGDKNDIFAITGSGRFKFSRSFAITSEYVYRINKYTLLKDFYHNSLGIGLDIETGGHVFQLFVTNAFAISEVQFIPYTTSSWNKGEIRFGFNVSRVFGLTRHAKEEKVRKKKNRHW